MSLIRQSVTLLKLSLHQIAATSPRLHHWGIARHQVDQLGVRESPNTTCFINRLPPDLLYDIFLKALPSRDEGNDLNSTYPISLPLHLSHVCHTWRELSLSIGELWSYLFITIPPYNPEQNLRMKRNVEVLDAWVQRSMDVPLNYTITLFMSGEEDDEMHRYAEYIIVTLLKQQHRWRDVNLACSGVEFSPEFPGINITNTPMLIPLRLRVDSLRQLRTPFTIRQSSRLGKVYLSGDFDLLTNERPENPGVSAVSRSLTNGAEFVFHINCTKERSIRSCVNFLRCNPLLLSFLAVLGHEVAGSSQFGRLGNEERIMLPDLRSLMLGARDGDDASAFVIDTLTLPSLVKLGYKGLLQDNRLLNFFQHSSPPLTDLRMNIANASADPLLYILRLLPTLKYLELVSPIVSHRFFQELTVSHESFMHRRIICPMLTKMSLEGALFPEGEQLLGTLLMMLKSRKEFLAMFKWISFGRRITSSSGIVHDVGENVNHSQLAYLWGRIERNNEVGFTAYTD